MRIAKQAVGVRRRTGLARRAGGAMPASLTDALVNILAGYDIQTPDDEFVETEADLFDMSDPFPLANGEGADEAE